MSTNLIQDEDYQVVSGAENGVFTVSTLNTNSESNSDILSDFESVDNIPIIDVSTNSCFDLNNLPKITNLNSLLSYLCELMIRFDGCVKDYQKSDFEHLVKTITNSLIYLYTDGGGTYTQSEYPVHFIGIAGLSTDPAVDRATLNHKYKGIYILQEAGTYSNFGLTVTSTDLLGNIVYAIPVINESGNFIGYNKSVYNITGIQHFRYSSDTSKSLWEINHNLNKIPTVIITDTAGSTYEGSIKYIDNNNLTITFSAPFKGYADLN